MDALRSITVAQHLFGIKNIVVVYHTFCGATSFTADRIIAACKHEYQNDVRLLRESKDSPKQVNIYGFVCNIDTGDLSLVVEDKDTLSASGKQDRMKAMK